MGRWRERKRRRSTRNARGRLACLSPTFFLPASWAMVRGMSFADEVTRGNALGAVRAAFVSGTLWAIAIAWSTAIREITRAILPDDTRDVVLGELLAASITTGVGVTVAIAATRPWCERKSAPAVPSRGRGRGGGSSV